MVRGLKLRGIKSPDMDIYDELARDLCDHTDIDYYLATQVVQFLDDNDFLDIDTLKETYTNE